jgi:signal transduction histidine kinase
MEAHGGSIHLESQEGKGTVVSLKIPVNQQNPINEK